MNSYLTLLVSILSISVSLANSVPPLPGPNGANCPDLRYTHHYTARGCSPVVRQDGSNCVDSFDCPLIQKDSNKCYYNGQAYEINQDVHVPNPCNRCRCSSYNGIETQISCANVECPEAFGPPDASILNETCYLYYEPRNCCGEKRCPQSQLFSSPVEPLVTCNHQGTTYKEGQQIEMPDCYTCTCTADFNSLAYKTNPACHQHTCYFNTGMLNEGCLPVYLPSGCCYSQFHCPSPNLAQRQQHCQQSHYFGYCSQNVTRYHFDSATGQCLPFAYSGCGGSINTFETQQQCMAYCTGPDPVRPAPVAGKCHFDGVNYDIGTVLSPDPTFNCSCVIPPDLTCILR